MEQANFPTFLESWTGELAAQANRIRQLIGSAHWLSDGNHKEAILRTFLRKYLPPSTYVGTGFVLNSSANRVISPQIDVLICDLSRQTPFLLEEELLITPPKALLAHIEVKSNLTSQIAKTAIANIFTTRAAGSNLTTSPWSGAVFFASESDDSARVAKWIKNALIESIAASLPEIRANQYVSAPICLIAVGTFVAFIDKINEKGARMRFFAAGDKSLAFGLLDLISSVRGRLGGSHTEDIDLLALDTASAPLILDLSFETNNE